MKILRVAMAQINSTVGDIQGNCDKIIKNIKRARDEDCDIVVFPELAVTGYPPEDLVLRTDFIDENYRSLKKIAAATDDIAAVVGFIEKERHIYNAAAFVYDGRVHGTYRKLFLPNYGVFDEKRYFSPGRESPVFEFGEVLLGINICEDIWYPDGPAALQAVAGASVILNLNASPYHMGKWRSREKMISTRAMDNAVYVVYTNMTGGQDELIFGGGSIVFNPEGEPVARCKSFEEDFAVVDVEPEYSFRQRLHDLRVRERFNIGRESRSFDRKVIPVDRELREVAGKLPTSQDFWMSLEEEVYRALMLGIHDYVHKNGFEKVALGVSGGVDSSLVAALACDALGNDNVTGIFMPTRYTTKTSREDAYELAKNLGFKLLEIPIDDTFEHYLKMMKPIFKDLPPDTTEQNIQARIRGNILMAYSNKFGHLVLATGNKSEYAVGYATLYGDMAGGFAAIKDISKSMVYRLSRYINSKKKVIPDRVLVKAPSAELLPDQKDSDQLPPYDILDPVLKCLIEEDREIEDIIQCGFDETTVKKVAGMVQKSEYKRRQAPAGVKITPRSFGRDRRIPITNKFDRWS